jgi:hypothetical protein
LSLYSRNGLRVSVQDTTGIKITSAYTTLPSFPANRAFPPHSRTVIQEFGDADAAFRYEAPGGLYEFDPNASPAQPTLSAVLPDLATPWSIKAVWLGGSKLFPQQAFTLMPMRAFYRGTAASKTITLRMLAKPALVALLDRSDCMLSVSYVNDATGKRVVEVVRAAPATDTSTWTGAGSWATLSPYKLSLTTANSIEPNTAITVRLQLFGNPGTDVDEALFIDPEFGIS